MTLYKRGRFARQELRMWKYRTRRPQKEIARTLGISAAYLSQILHGVRLPGLAVMLRIEALTGIPLRAWLREVNITPEPVVNITSAPHRSPRQNTKLSA